MLKTSMFALVLLLSTGWLLAQEPTPAANSGQDGMASGQMTVKGCLEGSQGTFSLIADSGEVYQLQGDTSHLSSHLRHEVEITGTRANAGVSASSADSPAAAQAAKPTITVQSAKQISKTCTNPDK